MLNDIPGLSPVDWLKMTVFYDTGSNQTVAVVSTVGVESRASLLPHGKGGCPGS